jgi:transposase InsO family protein
MSFKTKTAMEQRLEFVLLANKADANMSRLCSRFEISRRTGYKWLNRYRTQGITGLNEQSKKPNNSPGKIALQVEEAIILIRQQNPAWGAEKIHKILSTGCEQNNYPFKNVPSRTTITNVLHRNGYINKDHHHQFHRWQRFEYPNPNDLWQMDFKGDFQLLDQSRCHPLTLLDDHSRFNLGLFACGNEKYQTVQGCLTTVFRLYGLPEMILTDNGSPWGVAGQQSEETIRSYTKLEKWLMRLSIKPIHGRAYHPQTQGKEERFHRTLKTELLQYEQFKNYSHCQQRFDGWRTKYNCQRPHESLNFEVPAKYYQPSHKSFPELLPPIEYNTTDIVRKVVRDKGTISFKNKSFKVGKAFIGDYVAIRQINEACYEVYYCNHVLRTINL